MYFLLVLCVICVSFEYTLYIDVHNHIKLDSTDYDCVSICLHISTNIGI